MAAQRRIDLVLDSVKRLLRIGATANLVNLLQKQHPADLAQIFTDLQDKDREAAFSLLADRNGRLAMEAVSELGPEADARISDERRAYVERVRSAVLAGSYHVDSHRVAERLLEIRVLGDVT